MRSERIREGGGGLGLARGYDGGEVSCLKTGAADERAIDIGAREKFLSIVRLDAPAVLDTDRVRGEQARDLADSSAHDAADAVGFVGRADLAGADGPDRLIREYDVAGELTRHVREGGLRLRGDYCIGPALFAFLQRFAH